MNGDTYISTFEEILPSILQIKKFKSKYATVRAHLNHVKALTTDFKCHFQSNEILLHLRHQSSGYKPSSSCKFSVTE